MSDVASAVFFAALSATNLKFKSGKVVSFAIFFETLNILRHTFRKLKFGYIFENFFGILYFD